ncbi:MAG: ATP-binding cassette domain-containing protein, partial [Candidatus Woesearchaeota archaeon]|nr:ATP-binding cassette domain-containing protein [Candidatus Woesearchaeota archaeon]
DYAFALSGGQQQMLAMGRGLMQGPKLLLLDEPSLGLAPKMMQTLFSRIKKINEQGTSVLMVEQNAKQAVKLADRIYVLEDGKVVLQGGKDILKRKEIQRIYLGGR